MESKEFIELCKQKVVEYFNTKAIKTDQKSVCAKDACAIQRCKALLSTNVADGVYYELTKSICEEDVFVVWSCKTLQNNKALLSTNVADGMYYELTYNGDKHELYFDAYKKWENICIRVD